MPFRNDRPFRVLIVRTGAMGDVLHALPAVAAMREAYPEWEIGWAIEPRWRPLLQAGAGTGLGMPVVNRVHDVPTRGWKQRPFSVKTLHEIRDLRVEERAVEYDLCVDMQGLLRSAVVGWLSNAGEFVGQAAPRESVARRFYGRRVVTSAAHVIDRGCEILGAAIGRPLRAAKVPLPVDAVAEMWCDRLLSKVAPTGRFVVVAPTAGWGAKEWPAERYGAVAGALAEAGYTPLVNGEMDNPLARRVVAASAGRAVIVPSSIAELIALMRRTSLMLAGDTGPLHLAAALGRPVVAVFGPTDPARNGPYGTCCTVIRHETSKTDHRRHNEVEAGLLRITVEEVTAASLTAIAAGPLCHEAGLLRREAGPLQHETTMSREGTN